MSIPRSAILFACPAAITCSAAAVHGQCPPTRLVSPRGADAVHFGQAMASNASRGGDQWAITENHRVWMYAMVDGQLVRQQELRLPYAYPQHLFGRYLAMEGGRLLAGVNWVAWPERLWSLGGAFVFEQIDGHWTHVGDLIPPDGFTGSETGSKVAIDGDTILTAGDPNGKIVVSEPAPGEPGGVTVVQIIERPADVERRAEFGWPIAARDGWLFVSAHRDSTHTSVGGAVFVYRRGPDGRYELVQRIDGPTPGGGDEVGLFGWAMGFDGRTLAVGAGSTTIDFEQQGAVFVYELDGGLWTRTQTLTPHAAFRQQGFGIYQVAVDGERLLVHANRDRTERSDAVVYAFERTDAGVWRQSARLLPTPPYHASDYGYRMTLHGDMAVIGAHRECEGPGTDATGAAYLFDLSCYECPDLDADDRLTVFDYLEFLRAFDAGEAIADFDNDGQLTVADFLAFHDAFAVGCP